MNLSDIPLEKLSHIQLRARCKASGVAMYGTKAQMIERLLTKSPKRPKTLPLVTPPQSVQKTPLSSFETPMSLSTKQIPLDLSEAVLSPIIQLTPDAPSKKSTKCTENPVSLKSIQQTWLGRFVEKLNAHSLTLDTLGLAALPQSSLELEAAARFWMTRYFVGMDLVQPQWLTFSVSQIQITRISPDFFIVKESWAGMNDQATVIFHLVVFHTGQVVASRRNEYPDLWHSLGKSLVSSSEDLQESPYSVLARGLIKCVTSWDTLYPNNIHRNLARDSKEFLVALRFTLALARGLTGEDDDTASALKRNSNGSLRKLVLSAPHDMGVLSVHFSHLGFEYRNGLAFVQTVGHGGAFVLTETGHAVGTEEEGIAPLWMEIMNCTPRGFPCRP